MRPVYGITGFVLVIQMAAIVMLLSTGYLSYAFALVIVAGTAFSMLSSRNRKDSNAIIFLPISIFLAALILSSGYIVRLIRLSPILAGGSLSLAGFSALFGEFGTILLSVHVHNRFYESSLKEAGYDQEEIEASLNSYATSIALIGFLSVGVTLVTLFVLGSAPYLDVGILPALVMFGVVYLIVFNVVIKEHRKNTQKRR